MKHPTGTGNELGTLESILAGIDPGRALQIELTTTWLPEGRKALRLNTIDKVYPNRKPHLLCPLLVGDEGHTHADLLEILARALRRAGEMQIEESHEG